MPFQFYCPQGHLLQGDESHAGQACRCPCCDAAFIMPAAGAAPAHRPQPMPVPRPELPPQPPPEPTPPPEVNPFDPGFAEASNDFDPTPIPSPAAAAEVSAPDWMTEALGGEEELDFLSGPGPVETAPESAPAEPEAAESEEESLLHIPCPNGHPLETPRDMLGEYAMCPFCQAQFQLRAENSIEFRQQRSQKYAQRERQIGSQWMNAAIIAAVIVLAAVIMLAGTMLSR